MPKKTSEKPKRVKISAFLTEKTKGKAEAAAKRDGVSLVDYVAESVEQRLGSRKVS